MVPDAHCASCNGTFVEKIEGDVDDPRSFQETGPPPDDGPTSSGGPGMDFFSLFQLLSDPRTQRGNPNFSPSPERASTGGTGFRLDIDRSPGGSRTILIGGPPSHGGNRRGTPGEERTPSGGSMMAQYLLAMLTQRAGREGLADPFSGFSFLGGPEDGRMGDYVFNQEALDHIISQIMEQGSSSRPVPATEDAMEQLQREVLEEESPLLGRDCAVCKDQFALNTEEPDDQVIVTLPCKHPFHQGCIMPWLKSSATCPVCRFQLVAQPGSRPADTTASGSGGPPLINQATRPDASQSGGMFGQLFHMLGGSRGNGNGSRANRNRPPAEEWDVPGGWSD